jgi:DNA-binding transcriptional ArsR family regulator
MRPRGGGPGLGPVGHTRDYGPRVDRQVSTCITFCRVGDVFKALSDPTRRTILDELTDRNGQTLFEICARLATKYGLGSSRQAISQHLDVLEAAGLVETSREGRFKFHYINTAPLDEIVQRWITKARHDAGGGGRDDDENQPG